MPSREIVTEFAKAILAFPPEYREKAQELMRAAYQAGAADYERARVDVNMGTEALKGVFRTK